MAQVGRRLAEFLKHNDASLAIDPDVVEAACLAHDLGHPPFGHAGEKALNQFLKSKNIPGGFEGNAQSFRIVNSLAVHSSEYRGLNLTQAVLNAILKYPWRHGENPDKAKKWGVYDSEHEIFQNVREGSKELRPCLEAKIMDYADEVTYAVHDLEDFLRSGLIPPLDRFLDEETEDCVRFLSGAARRGQEEEAREVGKLLTQIFPGPEYRRESSTGLGELKAFASLLVNRYVTAANVEVADGQHFLDVDPVITRELAGLNQLIWEYVIESPGLASQQAGQTHLLKALCEILLELAAGERRVVFPPRYLELLDSGVHAARVVVDFVSGLTEAQVHHLHGRLTGSQAGSAFVRGF